MSTTAELAVQLAQLKEKISELSAKKTKLEDEYKIRERQLVEQYEIEKTKSMTVKGEDGKKSWLVSLGKKFYARRKSEEITQEHVYDALIADGVTALAKRGYDANSLTAYLKTVLSEEGASLPPNLAKLLDVREFPSISIRKK